MKNGKITNLTRIVARLSCFVVLLFSCPLFVHAETFSNLPYSPGENNTLSITSGELQSIQSCLNEMGSVNNVYTDTCIIFKYGEDAWYGYTSDMYLTVPFYTVIFTSDGLKNISFNYLKSFTNFSLFTDLNSLECNFGNQNYYVFHPSTIGNLQNGSWYGSLNNVNGYTHGFYGSYNLTHVQNQYFDFYYNNQYPVYCLGDFQGIDTDSIRGNWLTSNTVPGTPEPVDPSWPEDPDPSVPSPTPPNPPSNITVESLLTYIADLINYYGIYWRNRWNNNLKQWFKNVINNIKSGFDGLFINLSQFFKPYFDIALGKINEINNNIKNFFANHLSIITVIKEFVSGILDKVSEILESLKSVRKFFDYIIYLGSSDGSFSLTTLFVNLFIPSSADINQAFIDTDSFALITFFKTAFNKVSTIWDSIVNASVKKSIHVNGFIFHGVTIPGFDIDFSWFDNIKSYSDVIISAFLIINYIWFIFFRAPSFIRGHSNMSGAVGGVIDNHDSKGNVT